MRRPSPRTLLTIGLLGLLIAGCGPADAGQSPFAPIATANQRWLDGAITTTANHNGAWSWFEEERVVFDGACRLLAGSVSDDADPATATGHPSQPVAQPGGNIEVATVDLATGHTRVDQLGTSPTYADDHNSPSLLARPDGTVIASWAGHMVDPLLHVASRTAHGTWTVHEPLATSDGTYTSYANVVEVPAESAIYDFTRAEVVSPIAWRSTDDGVTWERLGPVLTLPRTEPGNHPGQHRPYMRYVSDGHDTIHFLATEGHPAEYGTTAIYHGTIRGGRVTDSAGNDLGPVGAGIDPRRLTPVAQPDDTQRLWHNDLELDPATGRPTVTWSARSGQPGHDSYQLTYHRGQLQPDGSWAAELIGHAGTWMTHPAIYEPDYAGLTTIDPANPDRIVLSANADPATGAPVLADGDRRFELWVAERTDDGTWTHRQLTVGSARDNFRPTIPRPVDGSPQALAWFAGDYRKFNDYDTDIMVAHVPANPASCPPPLAGMTAPTGRPIGRADRATPTAAAIATSQQVWPAHTANLVVLARDDIHADALAGTALAGLGPLLFTASTHLPAATADEAVRAAGRDGIAVLLGGTAAISDQVADQLHRIGMGVVRLSGPTRTETASAVADFTTSHIGAPDEVLVVGTGTDGNGWADAVTAGPYAAAQGAPVLLTGPDRLHPAAAGWLTAHDPPTVTIVGGTAAVTNDVAETLAASWPTRRIAGPDRAGTAVAVADLPAMADTGHHTVVHGYRTDGWAWALAAATRQAPLLFADTQTLPPATADRLAGCPAGTWLLGSDDIITPAATGQLDC